MDVYQFIKHVHLQETSRSSGMLLNLLSAYMAVTQIHANACPGLSKSAAIAKVSFRNAVNVILLKVLSFTCHCEISKR